MNELIKITTSENGQQLVSAKELHEFLEVTKHMTQWIKPYIDKDNDYGFIEGIDFTRIDGEVNPTNGIPTIDYAIVLDMAKELSMLSKSSKGKQARKYFIECEKVVKQLKPTCIEDVLISSLQEMKALKGEVQAIKKISDENKEEIQGIRDIIEINPSAAWRKEVNRLLSAIGKKVNNYNLPRNESYNALKDRAKCRPNVLVENLKKRAINNGMTLSRVAQLNMLDVLENDSRLREIYVSIVKDMAIKHGVRI